MPDQTLPLTDKLIADLPFASQGQYKVRDQLQKGFLVLVGKRKKTFMAEGEFWRDGVREFRASKKIDEFGATSTREARGKAKAILAGIGKGVRPGETTKVGGKVITLRQAWERYRRTVRWGGTLYPEQSNVWLFPADSASGHLEEHKEERALLSKWQ